MLNRELQRKLLEELSKTYPEKHKSIVRNFDHENKEEIIYNLYYLQEHKLVELLCPKQLGSSIQPIASAGITAKGIDFLEDDGGLSAILGTVTVKLHADTIRDLIDAKIMESTAIPEQEKPALREALKGMKEEGLKQLTTRLISYGLDQGTVTAQQLTQWFSS